MLEGEGCHGPGLTLEEIGAAALARKVEADQPDVERVKMLAERLGLEPEEVVR